MLADPPPALSSSVQQQTHRERYVLGSAHCVCFILNNTPSAQRGGSHCCSILQMKTGNPTERIIQQECARPGAKCFTCLTSFKLHRNPMRQVLRLTAPPNPRPTFPRKKPRLTNTTDNHTPGAPFPPGPVQSTFPASSHPRLTYYPARQVPTSQTREPRFGKAKQLAQGQGEEAGSPETRTRLLPTPEDRATGPRSHVGQRGRRGERIGSPAPSPARPAPPHRGPAPRPHPGAPRSPSARPWGRPAAPPGRPARAGTSPPAQPPALPEAPAGRARQGPRRLRPQRPSPLSPMMSSLKRWS